MARQLMKHDQNGNRYQRPPKTEAEIDVALAQNITTLQQRATLNRSSPDYISSECLVYLIRDAGRRGDHPVMNLLMPILLARCEANLCSKIPDDKYQNAAYLREEVLCEFAELFAVDSASENNEELDFFECRFNMAFSTLRIDIVRHEINCMKHVASFPDLSDSDEPTAYQDIFHRVSEAFRSTATPESNMSLHDLYKAIDNLPRDERRAVILCHIMGYEEESEDPNKTTAATLCGVTGRTIRNRLKRAAARLSRFKEDI